LAIKWRVVDSWVEELVATNQPTNQHIKLILRRASNYFRIIQPAQLLISHATATYGIALLLQPRVVNVSQNSDEAERIGYPYDVSLHIERV